MADQDMDVAWATFMHDQGEDINRWVADSLEEARETFDFHDGTHIKWVDDYNIGFLITMNSDEVSSLLAAWDEAHAGNIIAAEWVMDRCAALFGMLEAASELDVD